MEAGHLRPDVVGPQATAATKGSQLPATESASIRGNAVETMTATVLFRLAGILLLIERESYGTRFVNVDRADPGRSVLRNMEAEALGQGI